MRKLIALCFLISSLFSATALSAHPPEKPEPASPDCRDIPVAAQPGLETAAAHKRAGHGKGAEMVSAKLAGCAPVTDPGQDPLSGLPPDPGEAGKATLEGIDSDGDGVRDDVQRWVVMTYPDEPAVQRALVQMAKAMQHSLTVFTVKDALEASFLEDKSFGCLQSVPGYEFSWVTSAKSLNAIMLNTYDRSRASIRTDGLLNGQVLESSGLGPDNCDK